MAESENGQDRSEEPTEKRLRESREKGQVARSKELNTFAVVLAGVGGLLASGAALGDALLRVMRASFAMTRETLMNQDSMVTLFLAAGQLAGKALMPLGFFLLIAALVGPVSLGGWLFSTESLMPKFERMNPLAGLKRMFSMKSLVELGKAMAKFFVVLLAALWVLKKDQNELLALANEPVESAILHSIQIIGWSSLWLALALLVIVAVDVPFQLWDNRKKLMMTKQEVRDEYKDTEGKPEVKSKIRQLQRQMSERRMMDAVPQADVVITNPTHFAIALKYDNGKAGAPVLVAKGSDYIAFKIREIAEKNKVIVLESPALARAVYFSTELDREIPAGLYMAVAQVLAYVYQLRQFQAGKAKRPGKFKEPPIPPELAR